jgi:mRNA-degrading endonuclease toxin of MazEF toxin-antitoxin module
MDGIKKPRGGCTDRESYKAAFEVALPRGTGTEGAILCDQTKSLNWRIRKAKRTGSIPPALMQRLQLESWRWLTPKSSAR